MIEYIEMQETHVIQIARLEERCFTDSWSENSIRYELRNPLSTWLVAQDGDRVVGYVGSQTVLGETDMMNLAVDPEYRKRGIGRELVTRLIEILKCDQVHSLTLEVRVSNDTAISLYQKLGFVQVGRRPNYYHHPKEDAFIMRKEWEV